MDIPALGGALGKGGCDRSEDRGEDADAIGFHFGVETLRKGGEEGFGSGINGHGGDGEFSGRRGNIEDDSRKFFSPEGAGRFEGDFQGGGGVDFEDVHLGGEGMGEGGSIQGKAGVVDDEIRGFASNEFEKRLAVLGQIERKRLGAALGGNVIEAMGIAAGQKKGDVLMGEKKGKGAAKA